MADARSITGISQSQLQSRRKMQIFIRSRVSGFHADIEAHIVNDLPSHIPGCQIDTTVWQVPPQFALADPQFHRPGRVDMLIGATLFFELLGGQRVKIPDGPTLQESQLGWLVTGEAPISTPEANCLLAEASSLAGAVDEETSLHRLLERCWELEEVKGPSRPILTDAEEECENHFLATTTRDETGRFQVRLPFRRPPGLLGESKSIAIRRFLSLERRLTTEQRAAYASVIDEHLALGHLQPIAADELPENGYFLPHHAVIRPGATSTKIRVVFDASARTSTGVSLNECLHTGRKLLADLVPIHLRARLRRFLLSCDVTKMYMQVGVHEDCKYQLIVWRPDPQEPIQFFKFVRVVFGVASAPYLACRSVLQLAETERLRYPLAAAAIEKQTYMDNMLAACSTAAEAVQLKEEMQAMMMSACMPLHKWFSNSEEVLRDVPEEDREQLLELSDGSSAVKALGSVLSNADEYRFHISLESPKEITKRSILSAIARMFDPLGLVSPVVIFAKLIIQDLWRLKLEWDEEVPPEVKRRWTTLVEQLPQLKERFAVPRFALVDTPQTVELHLFGDASSRAYGAVAYLRSVTHEGEVKVALFYAKSKVVPLGKREATIPRLELCAAKLAADMGTFLLAELDVQVQRTIYWTDSQDVLWWLRRSASEWQDRFISNRIAHIQEKTDKRAWRHVPGKLNPADYVSRGLLPANLLETSSWFAGPSFLQRPDDEWPENPIPMEEEVIDEHTLVVAPAAIDVIAESKFANNYPKLRRIGAYATRFIARCRAKSTPEEKSNRRLHLPPEFLPAPLLAEELLAGRNFIVRLVQVTEFKDEVKAISKGEPINRARPLATLSPKLADGLLRVGGRLEHAIMLHGEKFPIILPRRHPLTVAIATHTHKEMMHSGPTNVLAAIRREFWPLQGRRLVQQVQQRCRRCFQVKPRMMGQLMGALPPARVVAPPFPFHETGVDYCGPFLLTERVRGRPPKKVYVAVFVCLATHAVTLEMVDSLSIDAFLETLNNVLSRRGGISTLHSDNMKGFTGAAAELRRFFAGLAKAASVQESLANKGITWKMIPPRAPHQGGMWEAAVKQFKHHLKRATGELPLTWPEMHALLLRIEAVMNSRPLMALSEDLDSLEVLTPAHFLLGRPYNSLPVHAVRTDRLPLLTRWQRVQAMLQIFWAEWSSSYLHQLQPRRKWTRQEENLKLGDLVLISDSNLPPLQWPLGRVIKICPDKNGVVRVVHLRTATGELIRDVRQLARLPNQGDPSHEGESVPARPEKC